MIVPGCTATARWFCSRAASVELDREEDVRGLRSAVRDPGVVRRAFEVDVVENDVAEAVPGRRQVDDARGSSGEQRTQPVHEHEVPEVVGAELGLEAVARPTLGCGHDARVGDDDIEPVVIGS